MNLKGAIIALVCLFECVLLWGQSNKVYAGEGYFFNNKGVVYTTFATGQTALNAYYPKAGDSLVCIMDSDQLHLWRVTSVKKVMGDKALICQEGDALKVSVKLIKKIKVPAIEMPHWRMHCPRIGYSYMTFCYHEGMENSASNQLADIIPNYEIPFENNASESINFETGQGKDAKVKDSEYSIRVLDGWRLGDRVFMVLSRHGEGMQDEIMVEIYQNRMYKISTL